MANINETSSWENDIYRIEPHDPVEGGEHGVDNKPHKQLANRTLWLKNKVDDVDVRINLLNDAIDTQNNLINNIQALVENQNLLDRIIALEDNIRELMLDKHKTETENGFISFNVFAGSNIILGPALSIENVHKNNDVMSVSTLNSREISVVLPEDYDSSTHDFIIKTKPIPRMINRAYTAGTTGYEVAGQDGRNLRIKLIDAIYATEKNSFARYIGINMMIEVKER